MGVGSGVDGAAGAGAGDGVAGGACAGVEEGAIGAVGAGVGDGVAGGAGAGCCWHPANRTTNNEIDRIKLRRMIAFFIVYTSLLVSYSFIRCAANCLLSYFFNFLSFINIFGNCLVTQHLYTLLKVGDGLVVFTFLNNRISV